MIQNNNIYIADEGKWFIRKSDSFIMGTRIDLGIYDFIDNYDEVVYTKEEYDQIYNRPIFNKNNQEIEEELEESEE